MALVVSDKIFKIAFWEPIFYPETYASNRNRLSNLCRRSQRDHSCWVWSNFHKRFRRSFPYIIQCKLFGRWPADDVIHDRKAFGLVVSENIFLIAFREPIFWPSDLLKLFAQYPPKVRGSKPDLLPLTWITLSTCSLLKKLCIVHTENGYQVPILNTKFHI